MDFTYIYLNICHGHFPAKIGFSRNENVHTFYYKHAKFQTRPMIQNVKNQAFSAASLHKSMDFFFLNLLEYYFFNNLPELITPLLNIVWSSAIYHFKVKTVIFLNNPKKEKMIWTDFRAVLWWTVTIIEITKHCQESRQSIEM